jgi:hypothetical protein
MVVGLSILVEVLVHGGMLTIAGSSWEENVITPNHKLSKYYTFISGIYINIKNIYLMLRVCGCGYFPYLHILKLLSASACG